MERSWRTVIYRNVNFSVATLSSCHHSLHALQDPENTWKIAYNSLPTEELTTPYWLFLSLTFIVIFIFGETTALLRTMRKGMAPPRRYRTGVRNVFYVYLSISMAYSYNIDLEHPLVFRGPNSSFFGYSVLEHYHDNTRWWVPFCIFRQRCNGFVFLSSKFKCLLSPTCIHTQILKSTCNSPHYLHSKFTACNRIPHF